MAFSQELKERIRKRLDECYPHAVVSTLLPAVEALICAYREQIPGFRKGWSEKDALLITYADSILSSGMAPLRALNLTLRETVGESFSFVHLLPFFPYTSDDGFSVSDFRSVRPDLGTWGDIHALSETYRVVFDAVINHVSQHSQYVRGFLADEPAFQGFCISLPADTDTHSVLRTRNLPLLHDYSSAKGTRYLWTTFSRDQVDLNYANPRVLLEVLDVLLFYASRGASMVRLDAIPYLWKELGTTCAHLPQTHAIIKLIRDVYDAVSPQTLLLTETNVPHHENISYFGDAGDEAQMIYNFSLAPLIVWSMLEGDAIALSKWATGVRFLSQRATYLNITATHDGIGMRPTEGILSEEARSKLCAMAKSRGGDVTGKRNSDGSISPYELNISYFDAINDPASSDSLETQVARFLCSQAIPMSFIGIPGLYIHSLFGSRNDYEGVKQSGRARSINRAQLDRGKLVQDLADSSNLRSKVFQGILRSLRIRGQQPAFHPDSEQTVLDCGASIFALLRISKAQSIVALHNVSSQMASVSCRRFPEASGWQDLLGNGEFDPEGEVSLKPYQVCWLVKK